MFYTLTHDSSERYKIRSLDKQFLSLRLFTNKNKDIFTLIKPLTLYGVYLIQDMDVLRITHIECFIINNKIMKWGYSNGYRYIHDFPIEECPYLLEN